MGSYFELTDEQKDFWLNEGHNNGNASLAIIYSDGEVEMDYPEEITIKFQRLDEERKELKERLKKIGEQVTLIGFKKIFFEK